MDDEMQGVAPGDVPDGPGIAALDLLYRFVAAVELSPNVAVHSSDRAGIVRYWNNTCARLFGVAARDAVGQPLASLVAHPGREDEFAAAIEAIWRTGRAAAPDDWLVRRADGEERWVYSSQFPVCRDGVTQQVLCMEVDVTGRKIDEQALLQAGASFRHLFERSTDAIMLVRGREIIDVNPAALRLFRCAAKGDMVGHSLLDFSPPAQPSGEASMLRDAEIAAQAFNDGNQRYEWQYHTAGGEPFWAEVVLTSVAIDHEHLAYAVIRDISQRKSNEHTLTMAAQVFENCRDAILILDGGYRVVAVNQAFSDITGFA
ncbi:MAG TPA: PAS domain S-box protein, partial [Telluria sp.]|nr:PAS domain S-box protein [Telluria sp.]